MYLIPRMTDEELVKMRELHKKMNPYLAVAGYCYSDVRHAGDIEESGTRCVPSVGAELRVSPVYWMRDILDHPYEPPHTRLNFEQFVHYAKATTVVA